METQTEERVSPLAQVSGVIKNVEAFNNNGFGCPHNEHDASEALTALINGDGEKARKHLQVIIDRNDDGKHVPFLSKVQGLIDEITAISE